MFRQILVTLICFIASNLLLSQTNQGFTGKVLDDQAAGIPYVNIGIVNEAIGTVSKEDGTFELYLDSNLSDTLRLRFSAIGYKSQTFRLADFRKSPPNLIKMEQDFLTFETITITPNGPISDWKGKVKLDTKLSVNFSLPTQKNQNLGAEIGRRFKFRKQAYQIQSLRFYINQNNFSNIKFRVNIYSEKKGKPDQLLQKEDIIFTLENKATGWQIIDLEKYDLQFNQTIIVALQWIDYSEDGTRLSMPLKFPKVNGQHFYKFGSQAKWKHFQNMASSLQLKVLE